MKNLQKSSPECFGAPANRPGWAGLAGKMDAGQENRAQWSPDVLLRLDDGQTVLSEPRGTERAGPTYARF